MKARFIIIIMLLSFLAAGPALAVKRVQKVDDQPKTDKQSGSRESGTQSPDKSLPPPDKREGENARPKEPERRPDDRRESSKERDRFIDEDDDGINDGLKKAPEMVKRKKETKSEKPDKPAESRKTR
jgi:hypothetical protein